MPGFTAVISHDPAMAERLDVMRAALTRRHGDGEGTYRCAALGLHAGWIQRSNSPSGALLHWNDTRDVGVLLFGELFTEEATLDALRRRGHAFDPSGADHVVHLYEEHGPDFVDGLNGWFSGLLIDLRRLTVILFNDRFGVGRIYVRETAGALCISSEAKSLLRAFPATRLLDPGALAESFSHGCVLGNRTLFKDISLLPCASRWTFDRALAVKKESYFDKTAWEMQETLPDEHFYDRLRDTFSTLLPRYVRGPGVGMSLTGGLDGRMIMAWAAALPGTLPCYSFGGTYRDCHDVRIARSVALACKQSHQVITAGPELLRSFADLALQCVHASDGTMDVSGAVELYVNRAARSIAPIRLTGNYGSEIVRGNVAFRPQHLRLDRFDPAFGRHIAAATERYAAERRVKDLTFIAFKQVPWYHHARATVERSQLDTRSPFLDNALVALMYRASPRALHARELSLRLIHDGNPRLADIPTDRGFRYGGATALDRINQAALDFSAKAEYAYDYGMPTWLTRLDNALSACRLERLFLGRHKFYHFRTWYRHELAPYVRDTLLSRAARERSPYRPGFLETMVEQHVRGIENHTEEIHRALTHELIHQSLLDEPVSQAPQATRTLVTVS